MKALFGRHPIHGLPFSAAIANDLEREYRSRPLRRRVTMWRKVLQRELLLAVTGQSRLRVARVPSGAVRVLWIYTWTTLGDSLMDLAVRQHLPPGLCIDLLIAPSLAPLQVTDPCWNQVLTRIDDATGQYDFVLIQDLSTAALKLKMQAARHAPFATVFEHLRGECFDRLSFAQRRMEQLFGIAVEPPAAQRISFESACKRRDSVRYSFAVSLGARDPRRAYPHWPKVLHAVLAGWPVEQPSPLFVLLGNASAERDLASFDARFLELHCRVSIARLGLCEVVAKIDACDAFAGVDGGLMHMAVALDKPGIALFVQIDPAYRLLPGTRMASLFTPDDVASIDCDRVAGAMLSLLAIDAVRGTTARR